MEVSKFSRSVVCNSLRPREPQHARTPCPSPTPGVHPNPYTLSRWCHATISFSVIPFPSCPQSFPASGSFQMSQLFASSGQSFGVSASASFLPKNTRGWSPLEWTGWISLQSKSDFFSFYLIFFLFQDVILLLAVISPWKWKLLSRVQLFVTPRTDYTVHGIL